MIAHLRGRLISKKPNQAIIEAGGVGYDVNISVPTFSALPELGHEVAVHVHTHVREDAIALFGFSEIREKQLFEKLIALSGIGPKLALTILSGMESAKMVAAIRGNDLTALTRIPGVGKKTAERMVLELRDKLDSFVAQTLEEAVPVSPVSEDVISALANLGFQRNLAERAVASAIKAHGDTATSFDALFRQALGTLSK
jgi:Holliday junction DNA helicase RuvA